MYIFVLFLSGIPQGKLIKRQRLPKNDLGDYWHWKDFNLGITVTFYGKVFFVCDCDAWTRVRLLCRSEMCIPKKKYQNTKGWKGVRGI